MKDTPGSIIVTRWMVVFTSQSTKQLEAVCWGRWLVHFWMLSLWCLQEIQVELFIGEAGPEIVICYLILVKDSGIHYEEVKIPIIGDQWETFLALVILSPSPFLFNLKASVLPGVLVHTFAMIGMFVSFTRMKGQGILTSSQGLVQSKHWTCLWNQPF